MLVDIRHEATHNELPQLPALRVAADAALTWLATSYWSAQVNALEDGAAALTNAVQALVAAASRHRPSIPTEDDLGTDDEQAPRDAWRAAVKAVRAAAPPFAADAVADALLCVTSGHTPSHQDALADAATQLAKHWPSLPACLTARIVQRTRVTWESGWRVLWQWLALRRDVPDTLLSHALKQLLHFHATDCSDGCHSTPPLEAMQALAAVLVKQPRGGEGGDVVTLCTLAGALAAGDPHVDTSEEALKALEDGLQGAAAVRRQRNVAPVDQVVRVDEWRACAIGALAEGAAALSTHVS